MNDTRKRKLPLLRYLVPAIVLIAILCYALFNVVSLAFTYNREQREIEDLKQVQESDEDTDITENALRQLEQENPDFVGWLSIDDTSIDYPVMKSSEDDPEFYLNHDFYKQESAIGSLFVGEGCTEKSAAFIIYGHQVGNVGDGIMFDPLDSYADYGFANAHQSISFKTPDESRAYRVFAAFETRIPEEGEEGFRYYERVGDLSQQQYDEIVGTIRTMSLIDIKNAPTYPQQLLYLSTCNFHTDNGRFVVVAYREDA